VITAVTPTPPPPEPYVIAPPAVVAPPAPPAPKPAIRKNPKRQSGEELVYPRAAIRAGIDKGTVIARVLIDEKGNVTDVVIVSAGRRHAGSAAGAGSAAITRAVNPASST